MTQTLFRSILFILAIAFGIVILVPGTWAAPLRVAFIDNESNTTAMKALENIYETMYRGEHIELVPVSQRELPRNITRWLATGETADIFLLPISMITALNSQDVFVPLLEFRWPGFHFAHAYERFPPGVQQAFIGPRGPVGVPLAIDAELFQVNVSLFHQAGVPAPDQIGNTWNWHDMIEIGRYVSDPSMGRFLLHLTVEFSVTYFLIHGDVISPDLSASRLTNPFNMGLLELAQDAIHRYQISPPPSRQSNPSRLFREGQLALRSVPVSRMQPSAVAASADQWSHFEWDVIPWPLSPFVPRRPALGQGSGFVVSPTATALPQSEAFLRIALSDEGQQAVAASGAGLFPARIDLWDALPSEGPFPPFNREAFALALENWQYLFFPAITSADLEALAAPIAAILEGRVEPQTGLEQAHQLLNETLSPPP